MDRIVLSILIYPVDSIFPLNNYDLDASPVQVVLTVVVIQLGRDRHPLKVSCEKSNTRIVTRHKGNKWETGGMSYQDKNKAEETIVLTCIAIDHHCMLK